MFCESQNNEPLVPAPLPLSATDIPPNLTDGVSVFKITVFVPIDTALAVMFCTEEEPCTTKFALTKSEPVIVCVPLNMLSPLNFANVEYAEELALFKAVAALALTPSTVTNLLFTEDEYNVAFPKPLIVEPLTSPATLKSPPALDDNVPTTVFVPGSTNLIEPVEI